MQDSGYPQPTRAVVQAGAGLLSGGAQNLPPHSRSPMRPLPESHRELESGRCCGIVILRNASGEPAITGADFFGNIRIGEINL